MKKFLPELGADWALATLVIATLVIAIALTFSSNAVAEIQTPASTAPMPPSAYKLISVKVTGSKRFSSEEVAAASGLPMGTIAHEEDFKKAARQMHEHAGLGRLARIEENGFFRECDVTGRSIWFRALIERSSSPSRARR